VCDVATGYCELALQVHHLPADPRDHGQLHGAGTITLHVPFADVPGSGELYSVTGVTATAANPSSTGTALFNVIDSTQPYDVP
jgi:hypothetical protein